MDYKNILFWSPTKSFSIIFFKMFLSIESNAFLISMSRHFPSPFAIELYHTANLA